MQIQTDRLIIRSLRPSDEGAFVEMASDGSLTEIFGDCSRCREWMGGWIRESLQLEAEDNHGAETHVSSYGWFAPAAKDDEVVSFCEQ